jgi:HSP20 family protein
LKQDEFEVIIDGNTLVIRGERKETPLSGKGTYYQMEIHRGHFERSILLPTMVDPDKTEASFEDGLLKIVLPKSRLEQPLRVEIKTFGQT